MSAYPDAGKTFSEAQKQHRYEQSKAMQDNNAWIRTNAWRCHCGAASAMNDTWLAISDGLNVTCGRGHTCYLRFVPENMGGAKP